MRGPTQRNQRGVVCRNDGELHAGSERAQINPRATPMFYRSTLEEFRDAQRLIRDLDYRSRGDFFADAVKLMAIIAKGAQDLDYRDREEFLVRSIQALSCWEKKSPIPAWAQLEASLPQVPRLEPPKP